MRRFVITLLLLLFCFVGFSQTFISTEGAEIRKISSSEILDASQDYATLIEISSELKTLKQTSSEMSSTYYIKDKDLKNINGVQCFCMDVLSDVGNSYIMIFDKINMKFYVFNMNEDYFWTYIVKRYWSAK